MKYDVFISYSRKDSAIVKKFADELDKAGYTYWMDIDGIETGDEFKSKIVSAIKDSALFLFFSSKDSNVSEWTVKEVNVAVNLKKQIIPVKLDSTIYNDSLLFDLGGLDYILYNGKKETITKLMHSLEKRMGARNKIVNKVVVDDVKEKTRKKQNKQKRQDNDPIKKNGSTSDKIFLILFLLSLFVGVIGILVLNEALFYIVTFISLSFCVAFWGELNPSPAINKIGICVHLLSLTSIVVGGISFGLFEDWTSILLFSMFGVSNLCFCIGHLASLFYTDYDEGVEAYSKGEYEKAVQLFIKAAEQGNVDAQYGLGLCYYEGSGVPQSYSEAVKWYRKSAEQGNADAQNWLGVCYEYSNGISQSYSEAAKWYRKSAEQGNAYAQCNLGLCYYEGSGVPQSYSEAVKWYRKSAEQGNADAQNWLGVCYEYSNGISQSYSEAVKWYRKSAEQGNAYAQCNLGICYEYGNGVLQSYSEAVKWYRRAADQGYQDAKDALKRLGY